MSYYPLNPIDRTNVMLGLISSRQEALAGNLSNVDTPGYVRRDIDFSQYIHTMNSPLETQLSQKMGPSGVISERQNKMTPEDELAMMQKNSILYAMATRRLSSKITEMRTILNVGK